ncbi:galactose ABC transporter substrate-binding protein [Clostridium sp. BL-8]|uniref:galactose ABC transporter substrate-binding protein n=1 Tax=Clostridium sp. BL-8 TaxID=349938 RepID=UPI00098C165F|nr:galactose ABC transporter substrate-binding protein [Clostridium sp. BL-8]OOM73877.1 D-galactose-binding periplasmic protein precursor [Clostridium sp. BL-8]
MKLLKKIISIVEALVFIITIIFSNSYKKTYAQAANEKQNPVKAAVLLYRSDDVYISLVRKSLEEIQKNNEGKIEFTFYDGKDNQEVQNQTIEMLLKSKGVDLILLNLVDVKSAYDIIDRIKEHNIPVVLFNREPFNITSVQSYSKAIYVGTNAAQAGMFQGKILINLWNENKAAIDINGDNVLQYVMLIGELNNKEAIERTQYSVLTINNAGIETQELASTVCNWNRETAKENFEPLFLHYDGRIEAIISNNDEMAIGAIEVLQKYGYNKGDNTKKIAVVGIDAIPAAQELIKNGEMTGSVFQDYSAMAEACYVIGMNLVNDRSPLEGTAYKFDDTGVAVRIPYKEYIGK